MVEVMMIITTTTTIIIIIIWLHGSVCPCVIGTVNMTYI
jgi:hypothetical protein